MCGEWSEVPRRRSLRCLEGLRVLPETEVEERGGPVGDLQTQALSAREGLVGGRLDQRYRFVGATSVRRQEQASVGSPASTGHILDGRLLDTQRRGGLEVAAPEGDHAAYVQRDHQRS